MTPSYFLAIYVLITIDKLYKSGGVSFELVINTKKPKHMLGFFTNLKQFRAFRFRLRSRRSCAENLNVHQVRDYSSTATTQRLNER